MKKWLMEQFLPMWAKQTLYRQLRQAEAQIHTLHLQNRELKAYCKGLQRGRRKRGNL